MELQTEAPQQDPLPQPKWKQDRRLEFIDFRLRWEGRINRANLTEFFGISVPQASIDIARYIELAPNNSFYDRSSRVYLASASFTPLFPSNTPERYLNELLALATNVIHAEHSYIGWVPNVAAVPSPQRSVPTETLIILLGAIRHSKKVWITYQSMSSEEPSERAISPHAIAHDGFRWHVRAYCDARQEFRDFLIARMLSIRPSGLDGTAATLDAAWERMVPLEIVPNPALSRPHQRLIELDYGMDGGSVLLTCRQALLYYALKRLGLQGAKSSMPQEQQIVLKNLDQIEEFLPRFSGPR